MLPQIWPAVLTLGWILFAIAAGEGAMAAFSFAIGDGEGTKFAISMVVTALFAGACVLTTKGRQFELQFRDAALLTVVSWFVIPAFAALPLLAAPTSLSMVDAYFEMVSGITTTGSTVMTGLDGLPHSILLWRSTVQWIGGIGIIGLAIVILPFLKIGGMQLFRLESSDRSEKAIPRVRGIASAIGRIYVALTLACFLAYWALGMTPFDALNHALTTLCTGGFSTHDASFGYYQSPALAWAGTLFMAAGGMPFLAFLRLLRSGSLRDRLEPQAIAYVATLALASLPLAAWLYFTGQDGIGAALTKAAFNLTSVITTTGYSSVNYLTWGAFAVGWMFVFTSVGGCTGSTGGGIKILRFQIMSSIIAQHVRKAIHPHVVRPVRYGSRVISDDQAASVGTFVFLYILFLGIFAVVLAALGLDPQTALSGAATALGNVGPGIGGVIGPAGNFAGLSDAAKIVLCVAMIMGRLEIIGVLLLFLPSFYR